MIVEQKPQNSQTDVLQKSSSKNLMTQIEVSAQREGEMIH